MSYNYQAGALFAVDREKSAQSKVRVLRIALDGSVQLAGEGFGFAQDDSVVSLSTSEDGTLVVSVARLHPQRFRVAEIAVLTGKAKLVGKYEGKGELRAGAFLTDRALHVLVTDNQRGVRALEIDPTQLHAGP